MISTSSKPSRAHSPNHLYLDDSAYSEFQRFQADIEPRLGEFGDLAPIRDWGGKLAGSVLRVAGLLHVATWAETSTPPWEEAVSCLTMRNAITVGEYLIAHAKVAFGEMGADPVVEDANRILRWIERKEIASFTKREMHQDLRGHFTRVQAVDPPLQLLKSHEFIRERPLGPRDGAGRPGSPIYDVNPLWRGELSDPISEPSESSGSNGLNPDPQGATRTESGPQNTQNAQNSSPSTVPTHQLRPLRAMNDQNSPTVSPKIEITTSHVDTGSVIVVTDVDALQREIPDLVSAPTLGFDIETTGLDPHSNHIRLMQFAAPGKTVIVDCAHIAPEAIHPILTGARCLAGHNLKFELGFLTAAGLPTPDGDRLLDTMLMAQLLEAGPQGQKKGHFGLASVCERYLGIALDKTLQQGDWAGDLSYEQLQYAAMDASAALTLSSHLLNAFEQVGLNPVSNIEMRALPAIAAMQFSGMPFDKESWSLIAARALASREDLQSELQDLAGCDINWNSHPQVLRFLVAQGHEVSSISREALLHLVDKDPFVKAFLAYRETSSQCSTYGRSFLENVHRITNRIHPNIRQIGAATGRMACSSPNLQNIPRSREYRSCFRADQDRKLVKADFSQIELRIAAQISGDKAMLEAFRNNLDLHAMTAQSVLGRDPSREDRQLAKALNFGLLYGMGADRFRKYAATQFGVTMTDREATHYRKAFFATYPGLRGWHDRQPKSVLDTRTLTGRRRTLVSSFTEKLNTPVQGTGVDILKLALARLWEDRSSAPGSIPVMVVHDEIVVETSSDQAEDAAAWMKKHMEAAGHEILSNVPVEVDITIAQSWAGTD